MSKWVELPDDKDGEETAETTLLQQIAALAVAGRNIHQIAEELQIADKTVRRKLNKEECKALIKKAGDDAFGVALSTMREQAKRRVMKAFEVLDHHLDKQNLGAAAMVFKIIDKEQKTPDTPNDTQIIIKMPGESEAKRVIDVTPSKEDAIQDN